MKNFEEIVSRIKPYVLYLNEQAKKINFFQLPQGVTLSETIVEQRVFFLLWVIVTVILAILYFSGVKGFGCVMQDYYSACMDMSSVADCDDLVVVTCTYFCYEYGSTTNGKCPCGYSSAIIDGYNTCILWYGNNYCAPTQCCGVLKNVNVCLSASESLPLIASYSLTFYSVLHLAFTLLIRMKLGGNTDKRHAEESSTKSTDEHSAVNEMWSTEPVVNRSSAKNIESMQKDSL